MSKAKELEINTDAFDDGVIVRPIGEIDLSCAAMLRHRLSAAQSAKPHRLIIDLAQVPYMDSSGVATLVEAMQIARRNQTNLILCCMQSKVLSIFEIARLDMVFKIVDTVEDAKTA